MQFNRIMNVKPGSMDKVMKMAQKFPERAKEVLGDDYAGPVKFMVRVHGPLNQVKWQWERESMDADMAAEAGNLTKTQILQQSAMAMIAQASKAQQAVLTLLQG